MTTDSSGPVRAVARVGVEATTRPATPATATLTPRRRPGHLGPVHVLQVVLIEAALLGLVAVLNQGVVLLVAVAVAGLVLLALTLARQSGRWWLERKVLTWHFRRRTQQGPPARTTDVRLAALRTLAPRLTVEEVPVSNDSVIGVARDDAGWFAVAEIAPKAAMADGPSDGLPLDVLVTALADTGQPGVTLQVVTHTVTAPSLDLQAALPVAYSYRELLQRFGPVPIPVDRLTWVAVRLDARALAEAGADSAEQAPNVVAAMLRKLAKTLRRTGTGVRILDRDGLLTALERSCDLQRTDEAAPPPQPREDWNAWHSGGLAHRSYWVRDWPSVAQAGALVDWLAAAPASLTSVAFIIVPANGGGPVADGLLPAEGAGPATQAVDLRCLVRVAAPPAQLAEVCQAVDRGAHVAHAQLFALDGEQGPATYATAPTGGGPR
jgi:type VII secretion protein EccE